MHNSGMRTTVSLADDVAAAVQRLRKERSIGLSEAVNELIRAGLTKRQVANRFQQQTYDMGEESTTPTSATRSKHWTARQAANAH